MMYATGDDHDPDPTVAAAHAALSRSNPEGAQMRKWKSLAMDPGVYAAAALGAGVGYLGGRSIRPAAGGAMVGTGALMFAHMNAQNSSPLPMLITGSSLVLSGLYLASSRQVKRNRRRRRTSR